MNNPAPPGSGLGFRAVYYDEIQSARPRVDWFEIISENYMVPGGRRRAILERIRADYPIAMHGVALSIASVDPLNFDYLRTLKALADAIQPLRISDHLAWTGVHGVTLHDLLPVPFTSEALDHIVERIQRVQDFLKRRLVIENASTYVAFTQSEMREEEFICELVKRADCGLLLDVNNVFVCAQNHGFDAKRYIDAIPVERVEQMHMAGHRNEETHRVDTHDQPVCDEVWELYAYARRLFPNAAAMIERDANFPPLAELIAELDHMREIDARVAAESSRGAA